MNKEQYNNIIDLTLEQEQSAQTEDSLATARAIFNNMGVALPNGSMEDVYKIIKTNDYMGWKACSKEEAQESANNGIAAIGINEEQIVVLAAIDEEEPLTESSSVMTISNPGLLAEEPDNDFEKFMQETKVAEVNTVSLATEPIELSETVIATPASTMRYYSYSYSCTTANCKQCVVIQQGMYQNDVVFKGSGKIWHCINEDMIYDVDPLSYNYVELNRLSNINYYVDPDDPTNDDIISYSDDELRLLYLIDPYGLAHYVELCGEHLNHVYDDLSMTLWYKDYVFRRLYDRNPYYFTRTLDGTWYKTEDTSDLTKVISESETLFGMHPIYDDHTILQIINTLITVGGILGNGAFGIISNVIGTIDTLILSAARSLSVGESTVLRDFARYQIDQYIQDAISNTCIGWALNLINLYNDINDIAEALIERPSFDGEFINYCANVNSFDIYLKLKNNRLCKLKDINDIIS